MTIKFRKILPIFFILISFVYSLTSECLHPMKSCPEIRGGFLNVHIVSHSHDDVGWLKTVDQYYYGANNSIQDAGVQYIYDSVVQELWKDPEKRFVSVEMEFFAHWWRDQEPIMKKKVRKLVERGQLEFVGGGWCMNDEAAASYIDIIDQMTLGLKFINDTFGPCAAPKAVWQVDPFGHSREQASIFRRMGFDYLFLGRIDHKDKDDRLSSKSMEMMWNSSNSLQNAEIFTGILYNTYSPPRGFCFDILCGDEPIVDDPKSSMFNIDRRSKELVMYIMEQSKHFRSNNIILTMGEDFHYQNAHAWFKNLDKLIKYINKVYEDSKIRLFYSTPSCYGEAVRSSTDHLPTKSDDFFPYSSDPHAFWTGYFSSRPSFKGLVRQSSNYLRACKQLSSFGSSADHLLMFQKNMAIAQHHDAVSGTAKQHVSNDYTLRLNQGIVGCFDVISNGFGSSGKQDFCLLLNVSQCDATERNEAIVVTLYNPLSTISSSIVRLPVLNGSYTVTDGSEMIESIVVPIPEMILHLPGRQSRATHELIFRADQLPPLGIRSFHIEPSSKIDHQNIKLKTIKLPSSEDVIISGFGRSLVFDRQTGLLKQVDDRSMTQQLLYYPGMIGNNSEFQFRSSGAYIFRPNGTEALPVGRVKKLIAIRSSIVIEVRQIINEWSTQIFRLFRDDPDFVEIDWIIGSIPIDDGIGKEIVSRFTSKDLKNDGIFYTDSNAREMIKRKINLKIDETISGNYYPVNSMAYIQDRSSNSKMIILNDRSQGVSSIKSGSLEFMVHRRLLHDDAFGVGEALNETEFGVGMSARGSFWIILDDRKGVARRLARRKSYPPIPSFIPMKNWSSNDGTKGSMLSRPLPSNVDLLNLEPWDDRGRVLIRLEHIYEVDEDPVYSLPVTVSFKDLFVVFDIDAIEEVNLSANKKIRNIDGPEFEITLSPMEIRTLIVTTKP